MPRKKKDPEIDIKAARRAKIIQDLLAATGTPADSWNPAIISDDLKMINYIRYLVDTWNPAQLNEAIKYLGFRIHDSWNPAIIEENKMNLLRMFTPNTVTGNPIELNLKGNLPYLVKMAKVTFAPKQRGTGDPSPSNIRPFILWDGLTLTVSDGDQQEDEYTATFESAIPGGEYDFVSGVAAVKWVTVDMGSISYAEYAPGIYRFDAPDGIISGNAGKSALDNMCSVYPLQSNVVIAVQQLENLKMAKCTNSSNARYYFRNDDYTTPEAFAAAMTGQTFCYKLATPTEISLTPADVELNKGTNVISTDGDSVELQYQIQL